MHFEDWLVRQYIQWREGESGRHGLGAFARWLGVSIVDLRDWMDGKSVPTNGEVLMKLAHRLSDDVYLYLGYIPPNVSLAMPSQLSR